MNTTVEKYISGLKEAYFKSNAQESWNHFEKIKHGSAKENIAALKLIYPEIPDSLIGLLEYVDGTYWREYLGERITLYFLGSDVEAYGYPYYLLSSGEIVENQQSAVNFYAGYINEEYDEIEIDEKITRESGALKWLHFSDCMNNGGTSQLFIDFSPSAKGKKGQVVRFLHDPDEFKVIADNFDDYLKLLMDNGYAFINEDVLG